MVVSFGLVVPGGTVPGGTVPGGTVIEEAALPAWLVDHAAELPQVGDGDGILQFAPPGGDTVRLFDEIGPLIQGLCLQVPREVLKDGRSEVSLYTVDEDYAFTAEGTDVLVSGRRIPGMRVPRAVLLPALVACAERYVALMRPAAAGSEEGVRFLDRVEAGASSVRASLDGSAVPA